MHQKRFWFRPSTPLNSFTVCVAISCLTRTVSACLAQRAVACEAKPSQLNQYHAASPRLIPIAICISTMTISQVQFVNQSAAPSSSAELATGLANLYPLCRQPANNSWHFGRARILPALFSHGLACFGVLARQGGKWVHHVIARGCFLRSDAKKRASML